MAINKPDLQLGIWGTTPSQTDTPTSGKISIGWTVETPPFEWQNWWQNRSDQFIYHINQNGVAGWDATTTYVSGNISRSTVNGRVYKCKVASSVNQEPSVSGGQWDLTIDFELDNSILKSSNNLGDVGSASTSFNNIKQGATTSAAGVVEKATQGEMNSGTANKYPDAEAIKTFTEILPGALEIFSNGSGNSSVSQADITASSGFTLTKGMYILRFTDNIGGTIRQFTNIFIYRNDVVSSNYVYHGPLKGVLASISTGPNLTQWDNSNGFRISGTPGTPSLDLIDKIWYVPLWFDNSTIS